MRITIYLLLVLCWSVVVKAQIANPQDLDQLLQGKTKYTEIVTIVNNYYNQKLALLGPNDTVQKKHIKRQLKMWHRWKFYNEGHLDAQGHITNPSEKNFAAMDELPPSLTETSYAIWTAIGPNQYNRFPGGITGAWVVSIVSPSIHPMLIYYLSARPLAVYGNPSMVVLTGQP